MKRSDTNNRHPAKASLSTGLLLVLSTGLLLVLLFDVGSSVAQPAVEFRWTPTIERGVYNRVTQEGVRTAPPVGFTVTVGEEIPTAVELYDLPSDIEYAPLRRYRYTVRDDRLYIVGPDTRKVVRIIN
jgi:hypothetical protein